MEFCDILMFFDYIWGIRFFVYFLRISEAFLKYVNFHSQHKLVHEILKSLWIPVILNYILWIIFKRRSEQWNKSMKELVNNCIQSKMKQQSIDLNYLWWRQILVFLEILAVHMNMNIYYVYYLNFEELSGSSLET